MKALLFILVFTISAFSANCSNLYAKMSKILPKYQTTTICRVTGINETRDDIMGFFFHFELNGEAYPAVLVYGTDYQEMLYLGNDWIMQHAKCVTTNGYRAVKTNMSAEQVLNKLFSFKDCEDNVKKVLSHDTLL